MTDEQGSLFDAFEAGDDGLQRAMRHAGASWLDEAIDAVYRTCLTHETLICDDVWASGLQSGESDRAFGQAMKYAVRVRWMEPTGNGRPSRRSHGSMKPEYRSLIYRGPK